jgi:glucose-6-phosphate 1-epimerase
MITISSSTTIARINPFGATVMHFSIDPTETNLFFISSQAILDGSKPIRGGIPIVFPSFGAGDGSLPSHGFARISTWNIKSVEKDQAILTLSPKEINEAYRIKWPYDFNLEYTVKVRPGELESSLKCTHVGGGKDHMSSFDVQGLFHTYFSIPDIHSLRVSGFDKGTPYIDQLVKGSQCNVGDGSISFKAETDWIFPSPPLTTGMIDIIYNGGSESTSTTTTNSTTSTTTSSSNEKRTKVMVHGCRIEPTLILPNMETTIPDIVVWNPWIEKSKKMADFGDDEYLGMVCVEPGYIIPKGVSLKSNEQVILKQIIKVVTDGKL